jgi:hypothetical protein
VASCSPKIQKRLFRALNTQWVCFRNRKDVIALPGPAGLDLHWPDALLYHAAPYYVKGFAG